MKEEKYPIKIEFNGVIYTRFPEAKQKCHRVYYSAPRKIRPTFLHRAIWEFHNGQIPRGYVIHHIDGNPLNNDLENLVCLSRKHHGEEHPFSEERYTRQVEHLNEIRQKARDWHKSAEGQAWHKKHGNGGSHKSRQTYRKICKMCLSRFTSSEADAEYCSRNCWDQAQYHTRRYQHQVPCPVCGEMFWQSKYRNKPQTCSRTCGRVIARSPQ